MGLFDKFLKGKKTDSNQSIIATGRDLGCYAINDKSEKIYGVGSVFSLLQISINEYKVWKELKVSRTIKEWQDKCFSKGLVSNSKEFNAIKLNFEKHHLFTEWVGKSILSLITYTVAKNGHFIDYSQKENKWIISSVSPKRTISLTEEQYQVWRSAVGVSTIPDVIHILMKLLNCSEHQAMMKVLNFAPVFVEKDLWNIEYFGGNQQYFTNQEVIGHTISTPFFYPNEFQDKTNVLAVGEEIGYESTSLRTDGNIIVIVANKNVLLSFKEYVIWTACRKGVLRVLDIAETLSLEITEVISRLQSLIDKGAVIKWPETLEVTKDFVVSVSPKGIGIGTVDNKDYKMLDVTNGEIKILSNEAYMTWVFSHGYVPVSIVIENFKNFFNCSQQEANYRVPQWIRLLMNSGLITINIIPDESIIDGWED